MRRGGFLLLKNQEILVSTTNTYHKHQRHDLSRKILQAYFVSQKILYEVVLKNLFS